MNVLLDAHPVQGDHCDHCGVQDDHCDHHEQDVQDDHCDPMNVLLDAHPLLDDLLHVQGDHCVVDVRNRELDVRYYGIQLLALAYLSSQNHHVHRCRYYRGKEHAHALDNLGDLGYEQGAHHDHHGHRGCGFQAYVSSHASLALLESEYLKAPERQ